MSFPPRKGALWRTVVVSCATLALLPSGIPVWGVATAAAAPTTDSWQDKLDDAATEALLTGSQARQATTIELVVAVTDGHVDDVTQAVTQARGVVRSAEPEVGFARIELPQNAVPSVIGRTDVLAADLDQVLALPVLPTADGAQAVIPPDHQTPEVNPYLPVEDMGAVTFAQAHPTIPQHRIKVGIVDTGVDLVHPGLQRDGKPLVKQWGTATLPLTDSDAMWVPLKDEVTTDAQGNFSIGGKEYHAPAPGTYRFGTVFEGGQEYYRYDLDGDGVMRERIPVLVQGTSVWVDTNSDQNLADSTPGVVGGEPGELRADNPATAIDDRLVFVPSSGSATLNNVVTPYIHIGIDQVGHGTHVAGIVAGRELFGSAAHGVAPEVDVYSMQACSIGGCPSGAMMNAVISLAQDADVDVINMSIGGLAGFNDGRSAMELVMDRVQRDHDVVLTFSAGNTGDGLNTAGHPANADAVISVGASVSEATRRAAYDSSAKGGVFTFSSRGLREDGGMKPQVVAPGGAFSTVPVVMTAPGVSAGYALKNGTSMASPMVAGAAALLLQAARADGLRPSAQEVVNALISSATHLDGQNVTDEGAGQVNIPAAWNIVTAGAQTMAVSVDAPVCTPFSRELADPDHGVGIYQRCPSFSGGLTPGAQSLKVTLTRTSGPAGDREFVLRWRSRQGELSVAADTVKLPLNSPVTVTVSATVVAGQHTVGLVEVDDPTTAAVDQYLPISIVVGQQLDPATLGWSGDGSVEPGESKRYYVEFPQHISRATIALSQVSSNARIRFVSFWPSGVPVMDENLGCFTDDPQGGRCRAFERTYDEAFPGIWEISVQAAGGATNTGSFKVNVTGMSTQASAGHVVLPPAEVGAEVPFSASFVNSAGIDQPSAFAPLVSENRYDRRMMAPGEVATYEVTIPEGVTSIGGRVRSMDGGIVDTLVTKNGQEIGHPDGVLPGEFSTMVASGDEITIQVKAHYATGELTEVWYEDRLFRSFVDKKATVKLTGTTTDQVVPQAVAPPWARSTTTVTGVITVHDAPLPGRVLGTNVRLRFGEMVVLAQVPVRFAPTTLPLSIDPGVADATGAEYVVLEGTVDRGFEVARVPVTQPGMVHVDSALMPWPAFTEGTTYTVRQVKDIAGVTAKDDAVTATVIDGEFVAVFEQLATPEPGSTPSGGSPSPGNLPQISGEVPPGSARGGDLAWTGSTGIITIAAFAAMLMAAGLVLMRRRRASARAD